MSDDLVKRLRWLQAQYENAGQILAEDFKDAADEIEEYERAFSNLHREYDARGDRIEELEDKLEKAVEALERLSTAELHGDGEAWGHRLSESAMGREILARMKFAHTTLAELTSSEAANGEAKGGKDE